MFCAHEIHIDVRPEKHGIICSDSQAALKALQATKTTFPLVQQCPRALIDISTHHSVGLFWVPGHSEICRNEIAYELPKEGTVYQVAGPEPALRGL
jgi:ribonuclease HI